MPIFTGCLSFFRKKKGLKADRVNKSDKHESQISLKSVYSNPYHNKRIANTEVRIQNKHSLISDLFNYL